MLSKGPEDIEISKAEKIPALKEFMPQLFF